MNLFDRVAILRHYYDWMVAKLLLFVFLLNYIVFIPVVFTPQKEAKP